MIQRESPTAKDIQTNSSHPDIPQKVERCGDLNTNGRFRTGIRRVAEGIRTRSAILTIVGAGIFGAPKDVSAQSPQGNTAETPAPSRQDNQTAIDSWRAHDIPGIGQQAREVLHNIETLRKEHAGYVAKPHSDTIRVGKYGREIPRPSNSSHPLEPSVEAMQWGSSLSKIQDGVNQAMSVSPTLHGHSIGRDGAVEIGIFGQSVRFDKNGDISAVGLSAKGLSVKKFFPSRTTPLQSLGSVQRDTPRVDIKEDAQAISQLRKLSKTDPAAKTIWDRYFAPLLDRPVTPQEKMLLKVNALSKQRARAGISEEQKSAIKAKMEKELQNIVEKELRKAFDEIKQAVADQNTDSRNQLIVQKWSNYIQWSNSIADVITAIDPKAGKDARLLSSLFNTAAYAVMASNGGFLAYGPQLFSSSAGLYSQLFGKKRPDQEAMRHKQVMEALAKISKQIQTMHKEMRKNFHILNERLSLLSDSIEDHFANLNEQMRDMGARIGGIETDLDVVRYQGRRAEFRDLIGHSDQWVQEQTELRTKYRELKSEIEDFANAHRRTTDSIKYQIMYRIFRDVRALAAKTIHDRPILPHSSEGSLFRTQVKGRGGIGYAYDLIDAQISSRRKTGNTPEDQALKATPHPIAYSFAITLFLQAVQELPWKELGLGIDGQADDFREWGNELLKRSRNYASDRYLEIALSQFTEAYADTYRALQAATKKATIGELPGEITPTRFSKKPERSENHLVKLTEESYVGVVSLTAKPNALPLAYDKFPPRAFSDIIAQQLPPHKGRNSRETFVDRFVRGKEPTREGKTVPYTIDRTVLGFFPQLTEMLTYGAFIRADSLKAPGDMRERSRYGLQARIYPRLNPYTTDGITGNNIRDNNPSGRFDLGTHDQILYTDTQPRKFHEYVERDFVLEYVWPKTGKPEDKKRGALPELIACRVTATPGPKNRKVLLSSQAWNDSRVHYKPGTQHKYTGSHRREVDYTYIKYGDEKVKHLDTWVGERVVRVNEKDFYRRRIYDYWQESLSLDTESALKLVGELLPDVALAKIKTIKMRSQRTAMQGEDFKQDIVLNLTGKDKKDSISYSIQLVYTLDRGRIVMKATATQRQGSNPATSLNALGNWKLNPGKPDEQTTFIVPPEQRHKRLPFEIKDEALSLVIDLPLDSQDYMNWEKHRDAFLTQERTDLLKRVEAGIDSNVQLKTALEQLDDARFLLMCLGSEGFDELSKQDPGLIPESLPDRNRLIQILNFHQQYGGNIDTAFAQFQAETDYALSNFRKARIWAQQFPGKRGMSSVSKSLEQLPE